MIKRQNNCWSGNPDQQFTYHYDSIACSTSAPPLNVINKRFASKTFTVPKTCRIIVSLYSVSWNGRWYVFFRRSSSDYFCQGKVYKNRSRNFLFPKIDFAILTKRRTQPDRMAVCASPAKWTALYAKVHHFETNLISYHRRILGDRIYDSPVSVVNRGR